MGWRFPCNAAATERRVHFWDPSLEQECSEPYLACTDLYKKGAFMLLEALVFLECLLPFKFRVCVRRFYARSSLGPRPYLDLTFPP